MNDAVEPTEVTALPVTTAILDASGTIVAVNDTWKDFARQNGLRLRNFGIGANYLQFCGSDGPYPSLSAMDLQELLIGQKKLLTLAIPRQLNGGSPSSDCTSHPISRLALRSCT